MSTVSFSGKAEVYDMANPRTTRRTISIEYSADGIDTASFEDDVLAFVGDMLVSDDWTSITGPVKGTRK